MAIEIEEILSDSAKCMKQSEIRALLKYVNNPEMISFAGGLPNPETFPIEELKEIMMDVLTNDGTKALQYGTTDGNEKLREEIAKIYIAQGLKITKENIIITTSSQQAIDLTGKLFINPGDTVLCELPSYLGALQSFTSYRANIVGVKAGESFEAKVKSLIAENKKPKFIYVIPDFQNPSGTTMGMEQRKEIINIAQKYDILIVEDSPYREIRFMGDALPMLSSMDNERVLLYGTFSKTFVPAFRIGWIIAPVPIIEKFNIAKQSADLCTPWFDQAVAAKYLEKGLFKKNLSKTVELYRKKRDLMISSFYKFMPEGVSWTEPEGGLFLFVSLPKEYNTRDLVKIAMGKQVAFVIGDVFHCDGSGENTMRINFSFMSDERIIEGVKRLAEAIQELYEK